MSSQIQIFFWKKELWYNGSQVSYLAVHEIVDYYWCLWNVEHINIYSDFGIVYEVELWWIGSEWRVNDNMRLTQYCAGPLPFALLPIELPTNSLFSTFSIEFWGAPGTIADCPAMSFVFVCWQINIRNTNQLSWAINYRHADMGSAQKQTEVEYNLQDILACFAKKEAHLQYCSSCIFFQCGTFVAKM